MECSGQRNENGTCIESLNLQQEQRVLDVGCGCGEPLIRIVGRYGVHVTGIDSSADHIAEARTRSNSSLVLCMGATHAFGLGSDAFSNAIEQMKRLAVPGGLVLAADGYMKQPASPDYRKLLGDSMPDEMTHAANVATGQNLG